MDLVKDQLLTKHLIMKTTMLRSHKQTTIRGIATLTESILGDLTWFNQERPVKSVYRHSS